MPSMPIKYLGTDEFEFYCKKIIVDYANERLPEGQPKITEADVYVVWMTKVLQNNKALLSTTIPDTRYYECTYDGERGMLYFDSYVKEKNISFEIA